MKNLLLLTILILLTCCWQTDKIKDVYPLTLADPFILLDNGIYYAYGTMSNDGIVCFTSKDLREWKQIEKNNGLALSKENSYADKWFWAPEVYKLAEGKYAMAYSADEHICIAFSDSPTGPFRQEEKKPMFEEKGIDNHIFTDSDGQKYIYFVRFTNGNEIWAAKLNDDFRIDESTLAACIHAEEEWEIKRGKVTEGPFITKSGDKYILTYSANDFRSQDYAIGFACSDSPLGPWTKSKNNPVLVRPKNLYGVGHHSLFVDNDGNKRVVFHSHYSEESVQPRILHITTYNVVYGDEGVPVFNVSDNYFTPEISSN